MPRVRCLSRSSYPKNRDESRFPGGTHLILVLERKSHSKRKRSEGNVDPSIWLLVLGTASRQSKSQRIERVPVTKNERETTMRVGGLNAPQRAATAPKNGARRDPSCIMHEKVGVGRARLRDAGDDDVNSFVALQTPALRAFPNSGQL